MEDVSFAQGQSAPAASTPARKAPGRPRGSGRGRGRGRGAGAASSSRLSATGPDSEAAESATASSSSPANTSLKLSVRPRRSVAAEGDQDGDDGGSSDVKALNAGSTVSNEDADVSQDPSVMSQTPSTPSRRGRGRGRPRGRGRASLASFGDREAPSSPSARRGRRAAAAVSSAQQSDEDNDDDDEAPTAEPSRSARGKRKRGIEDDEEQQTRDSDEGDADGADDEDEDGEDEDDEAEETQAVKKASKATKSKNNLPPFKKHPSRTKGYILTFANHQTCLLRMNEEEIEEAKARAKKKQGRGRKPRGGLPRTRIIEDSEDEDTDDDRPRPPPPDDQKEDEDDDKVMPIKERFKVKVLGKPWMMDMDELELPDDPDGDKKIDALGNVLGGECYEKDELRLSLLKRRADRLVTSSLTLSDRQWKAPSFTSSLRGDPNKVYFLSVDAARAVGYRDSLTLFRTDVRLIKLSLCQQEKDDLIAAGRLKEQLRGRNVTAVTARSVFKVHGAKAVKSE